MAGSHVNPRVIPALDNPNSIYAQPHPVKGESQGRGGTVAGTGGSSSRSSLNDGQRQRRVVLASAPKQLDLLFQTIQLRVLAGGRDSCECKERRRHLMLADDDPGRMATKLLQFRQREVMSLCRRSKHRVGSSRPCDKGCGAGTAIGPDVHAHLGGGSSMSTSVKPESNPPIPDFRNQLDRGTRREDSVTGPLPPRPSLWCCRPHVRLGPINRQGQCFKESQGFGDRRFNGTGGLPRSPPVINVSVKHHPDSPACLLCEATHTGQGRNANWISFRSAVVADDAIGQVTQEAGVARQPSKAAQPKGHNVRRYAQSGQHGLNGRPADLIKTFDNVKRET